MDTNATAVMDPAKTGTKPDEPKSKSKGSKPKASKPKAKPSAEALQKAMQTLADAGMMSVEEQNEAAVAYKLAGLYAKMAVIIATVEETIPEGHGIVIFSDGEFGYVEDEDEDEEQPKGKTKKGKKGKKGKKNPDHNPDWKTEAATIQKALIKYEASDDDVTAKTIHAKMGQRGANAPAITTIYNWLKGKSLPNQKYHRKLRSILGLNVG